MVCTVVEDVQFVLLALYLRVCQLGLYCSWFIPEFKHCNNAYLCNGRLHLRKHGVDFASFVSKIDFKSGNRIPMATINFY